MRSLAVVVFLSIQPGLAFGADVTAKVVDGLGRPLSNVVMDVHWLKSFSKDDVRKVDLVKLMSDKDGIIKGKYDEKLIPDGEDIWIDVSKAGYDGYSTPGLRPEFVLKREFGVGDLGRIAALKGEALISELRELLAGDFEDSDEPLNDLMFSHEHQFRPALRTLVRDPKIGIAACQVLAFIGVPEDVRLVVEHAPPPREESFGNRWAYGVVCALLEPTTEREWAFLRNCARNDYDDLWVDAGAIKTLKLISSPRSEEILKEVQKTNEMRSRSIERAVQYIQSKPVSLSDQDVVAAGKKVAEAIKVGNWQGNKDPRFNQKKDKALIDCEFIAGRDLLVHTATFHKVDDKWKLRGVRETMQALLARPPAADANADAK